MEFVWHILLTVCSGSLCLEQDVQRFDTKAKCETELVEYVQTCLLMDIGIQLFIPVSL